MYEVALAQNIVLERNRVGLRNLLKPHWKDQDAAFIVYYQADNEHPESKKWRFSYVSELKKFNDAGEYVANNTEPIPLQSQGHDKVTNREIIEKLLKKQLGDADNP